MRREINKLVRDYIPEQIQSKGETPTVRKLDEGEFSIELRKKLVEEAQEVVACSTKEALIEELADTLEVFEAIAKFENIPFDEIHVKKVAKSNEKGAFNKKLYLQCIEINK